MARTVVLGKSGTGKSWKLGKYLEEVVPQFTHAVHFDLENEEAGLCVNGNDGSPPVFRTLYIDREAYGGEFDLPKTIARNKKVRVVPDGLNKDQVEDLLGAICAIGMELGKHEDITFHLSVDEAHNVAPKTGIDERISRLITGGRKRGVEYAFATQRMQKLHEDILSQANWGIYFQITGDRDLSKIDGSIDAFQADEVLPTLEKYHCVVEDKEAGDWWEVNTQNETRHHPHMADDDGLADEYLAARSE